MQQMYKDFMKTENWLKYIILGLVVVILISIFWPTSSPKVRLVPVPGTGYYKAILEGFDASEDKPTLAFFGTEWCGYCKKFKPEWAKMMAMKPPFKLMYVDCDKEPEMKELHAIKGFPTIKFLPNGLKNPSGAIQYTGERVSDELIKFVNEHLQ